MISPEEIFFELKKINDFDFAKYSFSREPIKNKISDLQKKDFIEKSIACGKEFSDEMKKKFGDSSATDLATKLGIKILTPEIPVGGGHVLFAQFREPDEISVFVDCLTKIDELIKNNNLELELSKKLIKDILICHEIFHFIETKNEKSIFTKTTKVELWNIKIFKNTSQVFCLSEIAAMSFAKNYLQINFSPFILDSLLVFGYNEEAAISLYEEMIFICNK